MPKLILCLVLLLITLPLISSCGIAIGGVSNKEAELSAKRIDLADRMSAKCNIVYATKDIPEGILIQKDALLEREIDLYKAPDDAITSISMIEGYYAKNGICQGQMVSQYDLSPIGKNKVVLNLDSKYMNKLTDLAGGKTNDCSAVALMLLKNQLDMIETVKTQSYDESSDDE